MTPLRFICLVKYLILETVAYLDVQGPSPSLHFKAVNIGLNITLKCLYKESDGVIFYWYKQTLGQKPKLISEFYKYKRNSSLKGEFWKDPRFDLETGKDKNNLKILNVQMSDSATYYCTGIHSYEYKFLEGIILHVMESDLSVWTPQLGFEDIQSEGSVSLGCRIQTGSCNEGYSVYWVQSSEEHLPRIIYTQDATAEHCKRETTKQTNSCVYSYTIERMNESHAGTYHCAVASCGHILFGKGITLDYKKKFNTSVMVYVLSGTLAFVTMLAFFLAIILYKKSCKEPPQRSSPASSLQADGYEHEDDLHYAALSLSGARGSRSYKEKDFEEMQQPNGCDSESRKAYDEYQANASRV